MSPCFLYVRYRLTSIMINNQPYRSCPLSVSVGRHPTCESPRIDHLPLEFFFNRSLSTRDRPQTLLVDKGSIVPIRPRHCLSRTAVLFPSESRVL